MPAEAADAARFPTRSVYAEVLAARLGRSDPTPMSAVRPSSKGVKPFVASIELHAALEAEEDAVARKYAGSGRFQQFCGGGRNKILEAEVP